jgi:hypothetical protein
MILLIFDVQSLILGFVGTSPHFTKKACDQAHRLLTLTSLKSQGTSGGGALFD